jgi:hypothetical protein
MTERPGCGRVEELIPELAFGVAAGDDRADALSHLAWCAHCRNELFSVTAVADGLLLLTPEREPPPEFESRVMSATVGPRDSVTAPMRTGRRGRTGRTRGSRLRTLVVGTVAAAAVAALAAGTVWWRTADDRNLAEGYRDTLAIAHGEYFRAAPVLAEEKTPVGHMWAYQGSPSWIFVVVNNAAGAPDAASYTVRLTTRDGGHKTLGTMTVQDGSGSWGTTITVPVSQVLTVNLTGPRGVEMSVRLGQPS